ncbi:MAG: hypothetical protein OXC62_10030 [Aestuariivita sp.]|nr:hypothetical protein [Aestuariivita sp.]
MSSSREREGEALALWQGAFYALADPGSREHNGRLFQRTAFDVSRP